LTVRAVLPPNSPVAKLQYQLSDPPDGVELKEVRALAEGVEIVLECDAKKAKTGWRGNLIVNLSGDRMPPPGRDGRSAATQRVPLGSLPAVPLEIQ
jgi:hypothetical protein